MSVARPSRVLCVGADLDVYGAPRVQVTLLKTLDPEIIATNTYYCRDAGYTHELNCSAVDIEFGVTWAQRTRNHAPRILTRLIDLARGSDLVFSMIEGPSLYLSAIAARVTGRPLVSWVHNNRSAQLKHAKRWHRPLSHLFLSQAQYIICVSEGVRSDLISSFPRLRNRTEVIPNPVPLNDVLIASRGQPPEWAATVFAKPTVLASGRLVWQKGFDLLIRAAAIAHKHGADFNLLILGDGSDRQALQALAAQVGIQDRVFLPGFLPNPFPLYKYAAVFVLSSRFEGLPTVLIETLCLDLPIIAFDCPSGPREILSGGRFGRLVAREDVAVLGCEIGRALCDPGSLRQFHLAGSRQAEIYSPPTIARRFERVLLEGVSGANKTIRGNMIKVNPKST